MKAMLWAGIITLVGCFALQFYIWSNISLEPEEAEKVLMVAGLTRITIYPSSLAEAECGEGEHVGLMFSAHGGGDQLIFGTVCKSYDNVPLTIRFNTE